MRIEQRLGALAAHHLVRHGVRVLLVRVAHLADPAGELNPAALLHHVRGLVGRDVQRRSSRERHVVARRERLRAHRLGAGRRGPADVRLDVADVVLAERALDLLEVRELAGWSGDALGGRGVDVGRARSGSGLGLNAVAEDALDRRVVRQRRRGRGRGLLRWRRAHGCGFRRRDAELHQALPVRRRSRVVCSVPRRLAERRTSYLTAMLSHEVTLPQGGGGINGSARNDRSDDLPTYVAVTGELAVVDSGAVQVRHRNR